MKKRITILGLLLSVAILSGCGGEKSVSAPPLQEPVGVQPDKTAAYIGDIYDVTYFNSAVVPYVQELSFPMDGKVANVCFYPGMQVKAGDVLVELDITDLEARAHTLETELENTAQESAYSDELAQLDIELLQLELKQLQQQGASQQEIALKENEIAQKQATLRQTQQLRALETQAKQEELKEIRQALQNNTLRAPFSGQILYADILSVGSQIKAYAPIVFLADNSRLYLSGEYIKPTLLKTADRVVAHIGAEQYQLTERPMDQEAINAAALTNKPLETQFDFAHPDKIGGKVAAGDYAAVLVYSDYIQDALLVPRGAVLKDVSGHYVYVDENGDRVRRDVKIGKTTDGLAQILEGLQEGEVVYVP